MQRAGDELLAGAGLAEEQHGRVGRGDLLDLGEHAARARRSCRPARRSPARGGPAAGGRRSPPRAAPSARSPPAGSPPAPPSPPPAPSRPCARPRRRRRVRPRRRPSGGRCGAARRRRSTGNGLELAGSRPDEHRAEAGEDSYPGRRSPAARLGRLEVVGCRCGEQGLRDALRRRNERVQASLTATIRPPGVEHDDLARHGREHGAVEVVRPAAVVPAPGAGRARWRRRSRAARRRETASSDQSHGSAKWSAPRAPKSSVPAISGRAIVDFRPDCATNALSAAASVGHVLRRPPEDHGAPGAQLADVPGEGLGEVDPVILPALPGGRVRVPVEERAAVLGEQRDASALAAEEAVEPVQRGLDRAVGLVRGDVEAGREVRQERLELEARFERRVPGAIGGRPLHDVRHGRVDRRVPMRRHLRRDASTSVTRTDLPEKTGRHKPNPDKAIRTGSSGAAAGTDSALYRAAVPNDASNLRRNRRA